MNLVSSSSLDCMVLRWRGSLCSVLSWYGTGRGTGRSSGTKDFLRSSAVAMVASSTHFTFPFIIGFLLVIGWLISRPIPTGLEAGPAPLNRIRKQLRPSMVPAARPPGICLAVDVSFLYRTENYLFDRYLYIILSSHPGVFISDRQVIVVVWSTLLNPLWISMAVSIVETGSD